jgi:hypothetical protein
VACAGLAHIVEVRCHSKSVLHHHAAPVDLTQPILAREMGNPGEFVFVVGHDRTTQRQRVSRDQHVMGANRCAHLLKTCAQGCIGSVRRGLKGPLKALESPQNTPKTGFGGQKRPFSSPGDSVPREVGPLPREETRGNDPA